MRSALESRLGVKVSPTSPAFAWMVIHAATIITLCEVGKDGRVPYQRLRGRKMQPELVEFGESIFCQPLKHLDLGKAEPRWMAGIFIGMKMNSSEKLVATEGGIIKVRSIRRRMESERWNVDEHQWINKYPWRPYADSEEDEVHIRPPQPVTPEGVTEEPKLRQRDGDPIPRPFKITRKDLVNYGYTPGCPGCQAAANDLRQRTHTMTCRQRLEKAMMGDEFGANRIKDARARQDAYLEQQVRAADETSKAEASKAGSMSRAEAPMNGPIEQPRQEVQRDQPHDRDEVMDNGQPANGKMEVNEPRQLSWDELLEENDFHDIVNDDAEMYNDIEEIPIDSDDLADQVMAVMRNHVSEVWSQPRVTRLAH